MPVKSTKPTLSKFSGRTANASYQTVHFVSIGSGQAKEINAFSSDPRGKEPTYTRASANIVGNLSALAVRTLQEPRNASRPAPLFDARGRFRDRRGWRGGRRRRRAAGLVAASRIDTARLGSAARRYPPRAPKGGLSSMGEASLSALCVCVYTWGLAAATRSMDSACRSLFFRGARCARHADPRFFIFAMRRELKYIEGLFYAICCVERQILRKRLSSVA